MVVDSQAMKFFPHFSHIFLTVALFFPFVYGCFWEFPIPGFPGLSPTH